MNHKLVCELAPLNFQFADNADWGEWAILMAEKGIAKEKMMTLSGRLGTLLPYLTGMSHDDNDYTGAGKAVDGRRSIVFWYRNPEKQRYRQSFKSIHLVKVEFRRDVRIFCK